jgi:hypothetical protein
LVSMDWSHLVQARCKWRALVNTVTKILVQRRNRNLLTCWATNGVSVRTLLNEVSTLVSYLIY